MKNYYSASLRRLVCVGLLVSSIAPDGLSQHYATAYNGRQDSFKYEASTRKTFQGEDQSISLKAALRDLKKRYHIKFAYKEGLLDGKVVSLSLLNDDQQSPEVIVQKILAQCRLEYRQITKNQFTIFPVAPSQDDKAQDKNGAMQIPGTSPASAWQTETLEAALLAVTGKVTSDEGEALPGVNVLLKGTTTGTTTDASGVYTLNVPEEGGTLVFSFIGFKTQEIQVTNQTTLDVVLASDAETLNEVVVTALGIQKEKKALAYSVTEVKGDEFTQAREINIANALSGKVAGVNATGLSTGPGGSSRIIIRGNGSFSGDNQPLYVINGMPIDNTSTPPSPNGGGLNIDKGDGIAGINPDDIESISVLKGGTAAALYGSRASNGVILITTKKGKAQQGVGIEYNSSMTFETPSVYPETFQYEYGHGKFGRKPTTLTEAINWGRHSWGAKMDGAQYLSIDNKEHPYSPVNAKDNLKDFYRTGSTFINTLAFTGGTDKLNFRLSISNTDNKGILQSTRLNKKIANLNMNARLGEKVEVEAVAQYNIEDVDNRSMAGDANGNPNWIYMLANTIDTDQLKPGYLPNGNEFQWNETPYATNPYFVINKYSTNDKKNRFIGQLNVKYNILKDLFVKGSVSRDSYSFNYVGIIPTGTQYLAVPGSGEYHGTKSVVSETNAMVMLNYSKEITENFNANVMVGANRRRYSNDELAVDGTQFVLPYFYSVTNLASVKTTPTRPTTETNSVFGSLDLDYKGIAFLTVTGRKDWFSTLNPEHNNIFYPSVGGSFVLSEAFDLPQVLSYVKLRGSWAQVGGAPPDAYVVNLTYSMVQGGHLGRPLQQVTSPTVYDPSLKPLTSTTYEVGLETKVLENRISLDVTYYNRKTTDDIVRTQVPITSGYTEALLNVGQLENKGIELLVSATPVRTSNFSWDVSYNVAHNASKTIKLAEGLNTIQVATSVGGWAAIHHDVGRPYGIIKGYKMATNEDGEKIYSVTSGYEVKSPLVELGQGVPPLTMGFTNNFTYKRFNLNVLVDAKFGNEVFSVMNTYANRFGLLKRTLPGRDGGLTLTGVDEEGNPYSRTIDYTTDAFRLYYDNQKNYADIMTFDGSFVKLRQVILTYNIPVSGLKFVKIKSASLSFVARNLAILYKNTENFDPEASHTNGNAQGFESFALPRTRSYGANLIVKF